MNNDKFCDIISDIFIWFFKIWCVVGYIVLVLFCICIICVIVLSYIEKVDATENAALKGIVIDSGCVEKHVTHLPTNHKTYHSVCRLKVKWENGIETIYNYGFPALPGECIEQYDIIIKHYYFNDKPYNVETEHHTRLCEKDNL